jgi:hypothetical protein
MLYCEAYGIVKSERRVRRRAVRLFPQRVAFVGDLRDEILKFRHGAGAEPGDSDNLLWRGGV